MYQFGLILSVCNLQTIQGFGAADLYIPIDQLKNSQTTYHRFFRSHSNFYYRMNRHTDIVKQEESISNSSIISEQVKNLKNSRGNRQTKRPNEPFNLPRFRSKELKNLCLSGSNWLQALCVVNKIRFQKMVQWGQELLGVLTNREVNFLKESLTRLIFSNEKMRKPVYSCSVKGLGTEILCLILRDLRGNIVLYQKCQTSCKFELIQRLLQNDIQHQTILIYDQTESQLQLIETFLNYSSNHKFAYLCKSQLSSDISLKLDKNLVHERVSGRSLFYSKVGFETIFKIKQKLSKLLEIQSQEQTGITQTLGQTIIPYFPDRYFFTARVIKQLFKFSPETFTTQTVLATLQEGISYLKNYSIKREMFKKCHYPKRGEAKALCIYCQKKRIEVVCEGCLKIENKPRYLCIGSCYRKYHNYLQALSSNSRVEISKNIDYFDQKCSQIQQTLHRLFQLQSNPQGLLSFVQFSNVKTAQHLNMIAEKQLDKELQNSDD